MMNQNKYDFSVNTRQSKVAIILLIYKFYKTIVRGFLPLIAVFVFGVKDNRAMYIYGLLIVITVLAFTMSILAYYRFYFRLKNGELYIEKGVFRKVKLNIPFERIQTVNFEQNILLQIFNKYKVEVDTAGSAKKEFSFDALDKDIAEELRTYILERKQQLTSSEIYEEDEFVSIEEEKKESIFKLSFGDLIKVGITENHLKAGGWLLAVIAYFFSLSNDFGIKIEDQIEENVKGFSFDWTYIILTFIFVILLFVVISLIRTILKYFDLRFNRIKNGFKVQSGLLNRKDYSAPDRKIQKVAWGDNPLRRVFKIFIVFLKQAKSIDGDRNKSINIPIINTNNIYKILHYLYGDEINEETYKYGVSKHYFIRTFFYFILTPAFIGLIVGIYINNMYAIIGSVLYLIYFTIARYVQWKKSGYSINDKFLRRKKGIYGNFNEVIPWYKVQSIDIIQSIYQRRYNLANLIVHTAAGSTTIPYIDLSQAQKLRDYALYIAETDEREWM